MLLPKSILHLIIIFCAFEVTLSLGVCKCGNIWDCSNLKRAVILDSDSCREANIWKLQGNKLRRLPAISKSSISTIDVSDNELSLGVLDNLDYGFSFVTSLDISKNNFSNLTFLAEKRSCDVYNLVASYNRISDLTAVRKCYRLRTLVLENNEITSLPERAFYVNNWQTTLTSVSLAGNPITSISPSAFYGLIALLHLNINNTKLSKLETGVFETLTALDTLCLNNNQLLQLPDNIFQGLTTLRTLLLNENQLTELSKSSLQGMLELRNLDLRRNKLRSLPEDVFRNLTHLQNLLLNENQLTELSKGLFQGMVELQYLDLQGNKLQFLPEEIFDHLRSLQSLDLDDNLFEDLPSRVFARLHSLQELSVRNNRLKTFPALCGLPLQAALFNNNSITSLEEDAVRSLLRKGFELADIRENPVKRESTDWIKDRIDLKLSWNTNNICGAVSLLDLTGHGAIEFCVVNASSILF